MQKGSPLTEARSPVPDAVRLAHRQSGERLLVRVASFLKLAGVAIVGALLVRTFIVQPFIIPSGSMSPLLQVGDYVLVNKAAYGWTLASLPLAQPPGAGEGTPGRRIASRPVERGDVIVFVSPDGQDYVKRMIAREGERVAMQGGLLFLNGQRVECAPLGDGLCREMLPGKSGHIVREIGNGPLSDMAEITVPAGHYFVLGDNRDHSADSRLPRSAGGMGMVAENQVIGRASRVFFSTGQGIRWKRIGQSIG